jgi:hypothetical protein
MLWLSALGGRDALTGSGLPEPWPQDVTRKVTNVRAGEAGALEYRCDEMCRCTVQGETGREE